MTLPSGAGGPTTEEVGYFEVGAAVLAGWIVDGFGAGWQTGPAGVASMDEAVALLPPGPERSRYLCVPVGRWTALLTDGPLGTDLGVLPIYAARELGCRVIRVVDVDDAATDPARLLEVYSPQGRPPLLIERSITAGNQGGRWVFETSGQAYPFEDQAAYARRVVAERFTSEMVDDYLRALGVPVDGEPHWRDALLVIAVSQTPRPRSWGEESD